MFKNTSAFSSFSVPDLAAAIQFYAETLGIEVKETPEGLELQLAQGLRIFIYPSPSNKPAEFTVLNFLVDNIEATVDYLAEKKVSMEHYDMPQLKTDERGIARDPSGPRAMAWFKDPAGNILSLIQQK
jgi:catechol 2,3-dioxygenase-like lactoylglutathione lyase family enzyme